MPEAVAYTLMKDLLAADNKLIEPDGTSAHTKATRAEIKIAFKEAISLVRNS